MNNLRRSAIAVFFMQIIVCSSVLISQADNEILYPLTQNESAYADLISDLEIVGAAEDGHLSQNIIQQWATSEDPAKHVEFLFDFGDELSEIRFTTADGVGSLLLPKGTPLPSRFTRTPTGDRFTGPNSQACGSCHNVPLGMVPALI